MEAQGELRYSSYSFMTSALDEVSGQRHAQPRFSPWKGRPVPTGQEAGWALEPACTERSEEKSFRLCRGTNLVHSVVQSVAGHYAG
jgi:hypothetical protein